MLHIREFLEDGDCGQGHNAVMSVARRLLGERIQPAGSKVGDSVYTEPFRETRHGDSGLQATHLVTSRSQLSNLD